MSLDRWIHFKKMPKREDVSALVRGFMGMASDSWVEDKSSNVIELTSHFSHHLRYVPNSPSWADPLSKEQADDKRFIEIHYDRRGRTISVLTRRADAFTNAVADGLMVWPNVLLVGSKER